jgi:hypothetical protein
MIVGVVLKIAAAIVPWSKILAALPRKYVKMTGYAHAEQDASD